MPSFLPKELKLPLDVVGAIVADLVMYGEVKSWNNILFSAVVARSIAGGVKIAGPKLTSLIPNRLIIDGPKIEVGGFNQTGGVRIVPVDTPRLDVNAPRVDADAPRVDADAPRVDADAPRVDADAPRVDADAPRVDADAPRIDADARELMPMLRELMPMLRELMPMLRELMRCSES